MGFKRQIQLEEVIKMTKTKHRNDWSQSTEHLMSSNSFHFSKDPDLIDRRPIIYKSLLNKLIVLFLKFAYVK